MLNIFLINNNTTLLVALLTIDHLLTGEAKPILIASRGTAVPEKNNFPVINLPSTARRRFVRKYKLESEDFCLFTPHDAAMHPVGKLLMSSSSCRSVSYLEEGGLAHKDYPMRASSTVRKISRFPVLGTYLFENLSRPWFSRTDAKCYHFFDGAFPWASKENRVAVKNDGVLSRCYETVLGEGARVLLFSNRNDLEVGVETIKRIFLYEESRKVFLKPHPDLLRRKDELRRMLSSANLECSGFVLLDERCVLELEMMKSRIFVIGDDKTSLRRYAKALGSTFIPFL